MTAFEPDDVRDSCNSDSCNCNCICKIIWQNLKYVKNHWMFTGTRIAGVFCDCRLGEVGSTLLQASLSGQHRLKIKFQFIINTYF